MTKAMPNGRRIARMGFVLFLSLVAGLVANLESQISMGIFQRQSATIDPGRIDDVWVLIVVVLSCALVLESGNRCQAAIHHGLGTFAVVLVLFLGPVLIRASTVGSQYTDWLFWAFAPLGIVMSLTLLTRELKMWLSDASRSVSMWVPVFVLGFIVAIGWMSGLLRDEAHLLAVPSLAVSGIVAWYLTSDVQNLDTGVAVSSIQK